MQALLITFSANETVDGPHPLAVYALMLNVAGGLTATTWVQDGPRYGAIHLFESEAATEAYLNGPAVAAIMLNPACADFQVEQFEVLDQLNGPYPVTPSPATSTVSERIQNEHQQSVRPQAVPQSG